MKKNNGDVVLRQITDHIFQSINRIKEDIEYIIFLRKNTKIAEINTDFYIKQIDRFSRDVIITFGHLLDNDITSNTLQSLVDTVDDETYGVKLDKIRDKAEVIKKHRNKMIAHHDTNFHSKLGGYYPMQPFNYLYPLDPCFSMEVVNSIDELMGDVFEKAKISGIGTCYFQQSDLKNIFRESILGKADTSKVTIIIEHKCQAKECLLNTISPPIEGIS